MTFADPVTLIRQAVIALTGYATTRVLGPDFTTGLMPVIHVHHVSGVSDDVDSTDTVAVDVYHQTPTGADDPSALRVAGHVRDALVGTCRAVPSGLIDVIEVASEPVGRPYFDLVEVAAMVLDVTHRPTD